MVVVGGGAAGCMAALAARRQGAEVTLVTKGPGATALGSGAVTLSGDLAGVEALCELPRREVDAASRDARAALLAAVQRAGRLVERPGTYCDSLGVMRAATLVPLPCAPGEVSGLHRERVGVLGLGSLSDYDARMVTAALREEGVDAALTPAQLDLLPPAPTTTDLRAAAAPPLPEGFAAVAYPPGFERLPEGGFELLGRTSSFHSWARQEALWQAVSDAGANVVRAEVVEVATSGDTVLAVSTSGGALEADEFVLATGRFIGGGLRKEPQIREPLFGLTVFLEGRPVETRGGELRHLERARPDPGFEAGLKTDSRLRPIGPAGDVEFRNLRASGSGLAGGVADFTVPLVTGWLGGTWAAA